jgi:hypothetical protein
MVLRYILEDDTGEIIAFKVKVILILTRPSHLIFTSFPLAVQSHGLRGERRAQTNIASTMLDADSGEVMCQCVVTDISIHGCGISLEKINQGLRPIIKQNITMTFDGIDDKKISIKGVIRNTKSDEVNLYYGVKFEDSESDVEQQLKSLTLMID